MHAVIIPPSISVRRDDTYGRLDKLVGGYVLPFSFHQGTLTHTNFDEGIAVFLALTQGHLQSHILCMHLSCASFLYSTTILWVNI